MESFALSLSLFRHYLFSSRAGALVRIIAWFCIIGVTIGVSSLIVVISVMNGFHKSIEGRLLTVEPHLVASFPKGASIGDVAASSIMGFLKGQSGVQAHIFETQDVILRTDDGLYGDAIAKGITQDSLNYILSESSRLAQLSSLRSDLDDYQLPESIHLQGNEALIGSELAQRLGLLEGDTLLVIPPETLLLPSGEVPVYERLKIKGILNTRVQDIDSRLIFYQQGQGLMRIGQTASQRVGIEMRLHDLGWVTGLAQEIASKGQVVETWRDRNSSLFHALRMEKLAITTFLSLSSIVAGCSIVTVLVLLIAQKRKEIGILMAMGLSRRRTQNIFASVGLMLAGIGIAAGTFLGLALCWLITKVPLDIIPDIYYERRIPVHVDAGFVVTVLFVAVVIAFLGGWIPARSQIRMAPADALRIKQ